MSLDDDSHDGLICSSILNSAEHSTVHMAQTLMEAATLRF